MCAPTHTHTNTRTQNGLAPAVVDRRARSTSTPASVDLVHRQRLPGLPRPRGKPMLARTHAAWPGLPYSLLSLSQQCFWHCNFHAASLYNSAAKYLTQSSNRNIVEIGSRLRMVWWSFPTGRIIAAKLRHDFKRYISRYAGATRNSGTCRGTWT